MEKRNTILLTIIAMATLMVSIVGAAFAYFASTINNKANVGVNVNTSGEASTFTSTSTGNININVTSALMQQSNAGDGTNQTLNGEGDASLTSNATINVALNSPNEGENVSCSYDLVFKWDDSSQSNYTSGEGNYTSLGTDSTNGVGSSTSKYYPSTSYVRTGYNKNGSGNDYSELKELTVEVSSMTYTGDDDGAGVSGQDVQEKNIDEFKPNNGKITLLSHKITTEKASGAHIDYTIEFKFYNLDKDQSHLMNKNFNGKVTVENVEC